MHRLPEDKLYTLYCHVAPDGKRYVGITSQRLKRRFHGGSAYRTMPRFYEDIKHFGWDNFEHIIIAEGLSLEEADRLEREYIALFDCANPDKGYNISLGGELTTLGYKYSDESKKKMGAAISKALKGKPFTEEHKRHLREAAIGRVVSDETKQKLRECLGDRFTTPEVMEKRRKNQVRGGASPKAKKVRCIETGKIYSAISEAEIETGVKRKNISHCCNGEQNTAGGFHWEFVLLEEANGN